MEEITSQRLSRLRRIRESQRESQRQSRESDVVESFGEDGLDDDALEEDM